MEARGLSVSHTCWRRNPTARRQSEWAGGPAMMVVSGLAAGSFQRLNVIPTEQLSARGIP